MHGGDGGREAPAADDTGAQATDRLFAGPGEMRARCRALDWAATPLGPVAGWSRSLRTAAAIVLGTRQPMFLFWGPDAVQLYNDAYRPSFGGDDARADRALGASGRAFWTEIWDDIGPQIAQVMGGGEATWHEDQHLVFERHGRLDDVWWTYSYSPVPDDDGTVGGVLVVCQETTARVRTDVERARLVAALEIERARLDEVFRQSPAFLAVLRGPGHVFTSVNSAYTRLVGGRDVVGLPVFEALPEVRGQGFDALLDHVLATGEPFVGRSTPLRVARADGELEERFVDFVYHPLTDGEGRRTGIVVHGVDVTDAARAQRVVEQALAESEAARAAAETAQTTSERAADRLARLYRIGAAIAGASSPEALAEVVVRETPAAVGAVTGTVTRLSADGTELTMIASHGLPDVVRGAYARFPTSSPSLHAETLRARAPRFLGALDEAVAAYPGLPAHWQATGIAASATLPLIVGGEPFGALSFGFATPQPFTPEDRAFLVTVAALCAQGLEHSRLFTAERQARLVAESANQTKADFLATMSHELRTPLNAIGGYAELMQLGIRGTVTAEQRDDLERIQRAQRHLLGLINGVLTFAKIDAGAVQYEITDVPLAEVLHTCEALLAPQVRTKGLRCVYPGVDPALRVRADREKVQQIVLNLLANAVKFTEPGGQVTLAGAAPVDGRDVVRVTVTDTGIGIPADQLARVFEPFVQVDSVYTRTQQGTGLGLAISRELARAMGGDVTAESTPGAGSTFTLTLARA